MPTQIKRKRGRPSKADACKADAPRTDAPKSDGTNKIVVTPWKIGPGRPKGGKHVVAAKEDASDIPVSKKRGRPCKADACKADAPKSTGRNKILVTPGERGPGERGPGERGPGRPPNKISGVVEIDSDSESESSEEEKTTSGLVVRDTDNERQEAYKIEVNVINALVSTHMRELTDDIADKIMGSDYINCKRVNHLMTHFSSLMDQTAFLISEKLMAEGE